jgi:hypothetical protein
MLKMRSIDAYTSDYSLCWFDYKAGYNTVFAEYGFNLSRPIATALCKRATEVQEEDWSVMNTWTYDFSPYIESAPQDLNILGIN